MNHSDYTSQMQRIIQSIKSSMPASYCTLLDGSIIWCGQITEQLLLQSVDSYENPQKTAKLNFTTKIGIMIFTPPINPRIWIGSSELFNHIKSEHPEFNNIDILKFIVDNRKEYALNNLLEEKHDYYLITDITSHESVESMLLETERRSIDETNYEYFLFINPYHLIDIFFTHRFINEIAF